MIGLCFEILSALKFKCRNAQGQIQSEVEGGAARRKDAQSIIESKRAEGT